MSPLLASESGTVRVAIGTGPIARNRDAEALNTVARRPMAGLATLVNWPPGPRRSVPTQTGTAIASGTSRPTTLAVAGSGRPCVWRSAAAADSTRKIGFRMTTSA